MKRDTDGMPLLPGDKPMSAHAKGLLAHIMAIIEQQAGAFAGAVHHGTITMEEYQACVDEFALFALSTSANTLFGDPINHKAPVPDEETAKALFQGHFAPIVDLAAVEGRGGIIDFFKRGVEGQVAN